VSKENNMTDMIDHPPHYTSHPSGIEAIELCRLMPFSLGNAAKYILRAGLKGSAIEDVKKAIWYLDDYRNTLATDALAPPQRLAASQVAQRVQHGRDGHIEGFIRALYGREHEVIDNAGEVVGRVEMEHRFVTVERLGIAKLYLEGMIQVLEDEEASRASDHEP
jgi:hypothetical protein